MVLHVKTIETSRTRKGRCIVNRLNQINQIINGNNIPEKPGLQFETPDLNLASFLFCREFNFVGFKRLGDGRTVFVFTESPKLRHAIVDYANDGSVPVRTFCNTLRDLRGIIR